MFVTQTLASSTKMARAKRRPPSRKHRERNHSRPRQWLEMVTTKISSQPESQGRGVARYRTEWMKPLKAVSPKPKRAAVAAPTSSWGFQSVIKYMLWFQKTNKNSTRLSQIHLDQQCPYSTKVTGFMGSACHHCPHSVVLHHSTVYVQWNVV